MIPNPLRTRLAAAAALVVLTAACSSDSGGDQASRRAQRATEAAVEPKRISLDRGKPVELAELGALNPTVAVDTKSQAVFVAWAWDIPVAEDAPLVDGRPPEVLQEVVVAKSADGGKSFGEAVVVSPPGMRVLSLAASPTQVAVGPDGEVYVLYLENTRQDLPGWDSGFSTMWLSRSDDGGRTFPDPVAVTSEAGEGLVTSTEMASLLVAPDGDLFVSFLDYREAVGEALDRKAGKAPAEAGGGHGDHSPGPATQLRIARSSDGGRSWSPSVLVAQPVCGGTQAAQGEADGPLAVTTRSESLELKDSYDAVRDPLISVSTDDGATFSKARKIHDDRFKVSTCPEVNAGLAAGRRGTMHAAWYTGATTGPGVYYATSTDGGTTWSEPLILLADEWVPYGSVRLALDGDGAAWVAYEDGRNEAEDRIQVVRVSPDGALDASRTWAGRSPSVAVTDDGVAVAWGSESADGGPGSVTVARVTPKQSAD